VCTQRTPLRDSDRGSEPPILRVHNLEVYYGSGRIDQLRLLDGVHCEIRAGEIVGLLGESGAGKTTLAKAILGLLPRPGYLVHGSITFDGTPLLALKQHEMRAIRGARVSLVHQDSSVLNPVMRVGDQIVEVLRAHRDCSSQQYRESALSLLRDLELVDPERVYRAYPHQLSGGQRQRIAIAQALACEPALVIADEPTSSLDARTSTQVLRLLARLTWSRRTAVLLISHDCSVLAEISDRLMVMYTGRIVEQGAPAEVLQAPRHPYTCALLECRQRLQMMGPRYPGR
jgi:peptide/nickel transport system ATP-binding protein